MLCLRLKPGESIGIGPICIRVFSTNKTAVRVGIDAPKDYPIYRIMKIVNGQLVKVPKPDCEKVCIVDKDGNMSDQQLADYLLEYLLLGYDKI